MFVEQVQRSKAVIDKQTIQSPYNDILSNALFVCFWRDSPQWDRVVSFTRFLDHTQRRTTVGRTPLNEWLARLRYLYLTTHTTLTKDRHPCFRWDSNTQSQQASGRRPTPQTARPLGSTLNNVYLTKNRHIWYIWLFNYILLLYV